MNDYTINGHHFRTYRNHDGEQRYEIVRCSDGAIVEDEDFDGDTADFARFVEDWLAAEDVEEVHRPSGRCHRRRADQPGPHRRVPRRPDASAHGDGTDGFFEDSDGVLYFDLEALDERAEADREMSLGERVLADLTADGRPGPIRLRRRDLVGVVALESGLVEDDVFELMDAIDVLASTGVEREAMVELPRVEMRDLVGRQQPLCGLAIENGRPLVAHADVLAAMIHRPVDQTQRALEVMVEVIEAWPTDATAYVPGFGHHGTEAAIDGLRHEYVVEELERLERRGAPGRRAWLVEIAAEKWDPRAGETWSGEFPDQLEAGREACSLDVGDVVVFTVARAGARAHGIGLVRGESEDPANTGRRWIDVDFRLGFAWDPIRNDDGRLEALLADDVRAGARIGADDIVQISSDALARILLLVRLRRAYKI